MIEHKQIVKRMTVLHFYLNIMLFSSKSEAQQLHNLLGIS